MRVNAYRAIVDTAFDAIIVSDEVGMIKAFNPAAERIFGYKANEVIGENVAVLMPDAYRAEHDDYLHRYRSTGERKIIGIGRTVEGRRKDGTFVPLDLSIAEWHGDQGQRRFTAMLRDVTARQRAQQALREAKEKAEAAAQTETELRRTVQKVNDELRSANQSLEEFTSIVAHDLRAPLRRIGAFIQILRQDYGSRFDDEGKDLLSRIERGGHRMKLMLDSLLAYSKYHSAAIDGKVAVLDHVVADALANFDFDALDVDVRVDVNKAPAVRGDPMLLSHVLQNLISNSIKFRNGIEPTINIAAECDRSQVRISVIDNGIGIEAEFAERVFEMFYRLHDEDKYEGTGIGLSVCRKIVNDHEGRIWIDTSHRDGTKVSFTLHSASESLPQRKSDEEPIGADALAP